MPHRVFESTTDLVYGGHKIIAENGVCLAESPLFERTNSVLYSDIDYERIIFERSMDQNFNSCAFSHGHQIEFIKAPLSPIKVLGVNDTLIRKFPKNPFISNDPAVMDQNCNRIFSIQSEGLARRLEHTGSKKAVIGISGGLDSTLALLVCTEAFRLIGKDTTDIITITMLVFGTTEKLQ